MLNVGILLGVL